MTGLVMVNLMITSLKPWFLYLLECQDGSLYTGIAVDVAARFVAHKNGTGARYTRSHPPLKILVIVQYPCRSSASKAEYATKQLSVSEKRAFIVNNQDASLIKLPD